MNNQDQYCHQPIFVDEIVQYFSLDRMNQNATFVDCTTGEGGHSEIFVKHIVDGTLISIDRDQSILEKAKKRLSQYNKTVITRNGNFSQLDSILNDLKIDQVDYLLYDLGISMYHYKESQRGFSFEDDLSLDMRLDENRDLTAYDIVNHFSEREIRDILYVYGEENRGKLIARKIVEARKDNEINTAQDLKLLFEKLIPKWKYEGKVHPATKTFQALRIYINQELDHVEKGLVQGIHKLRVGGRIAVITFHSLEDRIVKRIFKWYSQKCICPSDFPVCQCGGKETVKLLTKKPIMPTNKEVNLNPSARSAKLRVVEKVYDTSNKIWQIQKNSQ